MLNKICLVGRAGEDPSDKLKYTGQGTAVLSMSMAVQRNYKDKSGEYGVDWIDIVIWRKTAEFVANNLKKGKLFSVEGRLQKRSYETDSGQKRYVTEVVAENVNIIEWGDKDQKQKDEEGVDVPF